ncbi:hypothetical protein J6590_091951, partial [Homalodisca vitripennis]
MFLLPSSSNSTANESVPLQQHDLARATTHPPSTYTRLYFPSQSEIQGWPPSPAHSFEREVYRLTLLSYPQYSSTERYNIHLDDLSPEIQSTVIQDPPASVDFDHQIRYPVSMGEGTFSQLSPPRAASPSGSPPLRPAHREHKMPLEDRGHSALCAYGLQTPAL